MGAVAGAFDVPAAQRVGVDGATGHGLAALPSVLDGRVLALVVGDLDAAAGVVAHRHAAFAAPADAQALQQRDPFPGRAGKQFRRVNGHLHLPALRAALEREIAEPVGSDVHNDEVSAA